MRIEEKLDKYFKLTEEALAKIKSADSEEAKSFLDTAQRYFSDAKYFRQKGDLLTALAAVSYAHAWLDAGAKLGFFDVKDNRLFCVE